MAERALATIRIVDEILPIEGKDRIEVAVFGGWEVIVKKGEFWPGGWAIFFEIDSFIPTSVAPFLTRPNKVPKEYNGTQGERLRTVRMGGQLSQGLCLPVYQGSLAGIGEGYYVQDPNEPTSPAFVFRLEEGNDVTDLFGIQLWEPPQNVFMGGGHAVEAFPYGIPKTSQPRAQNIKSQIARAYENGESYETTEKMDGSSMQVVVAYNDDNTINRLVFSRNCIISDEESVFHKVAVSSGIWDKIASTGRQLSIQGELVGPNIQGNRYALKEPVFLVYAIWDIEQRQFLLPGERHDLCSALQLDHVPVISIGQFVDSPQAALEFAERKSAANDKRIAEGVCYAHLTKRGVSFKAVSNSYLEEIG